MKIYRWKWAVLLFAAAALMGGCAGENGLVQAMAETNKEQAEDSVGSPAGGNDMEAHKPEEAAYSADDFDNWNKLVEDNCISDSFAEALSRFAFESGSRILSEEAGNANYSPLSLYYAMALAGSGAEGVTAAQILNSLGIGDQEQLADQCRKLYQAIYYQQQRKKVRLESVGEGGYDSTVRLANSLWISDRLRINEEYQKLAASDFFASSYRVDFTGEAAGRRIGDWIAEQTNGVLNPQIELDSDTRMVILNTLYFYGGWIDAFDKTRTADDLFTRADKSQVTCPFMNRIDGMGEFKKGDGYTVSALRTNNDCSMVFLLPDEGRSVEEFMETPEMLEGTLGAKQETWQRGEVTWKVPRFSFGSSFDLAEQLKSMGITNMFEPEKAEFGKLSREPLYASGVIQETHIGVDEDGVEGAAYTMVMAAGSAGMQERQSAEMILNRPFLFGIQENDSGAWLFLGVCRSPEQA